MDFVAVDGGSCAFGAITPSVPSTSLVPGSALGGGYGTRVKKAWLVGKFVGLTCDSQDEMTICDLENKMKEWWQP